MVVTVSSGGSGIDKPMYIELYPNTNDADEVLEDRIAPRIGSICEELLDHNAIDYYEVNIHYDHPGVDPGIWMGEFIENFRDWGGYNAYHGCKLGVTTELEGGVADEVTSSTNTSFDNVNVAALGTNDNGYEQNANIAIQEVLHTFLAYDLLVDSNMVQSGDSVHEHDLGMVYGDHSSSPMITSYEGDHTEHGNCDDSPGHWGTYTASLTGCTKDAVKETAADAT